MQAIGLMSGTSLDGVDAALINTDGKTIKEFGATLHIPYSNELQNKLRQVINGELAHHQVENELTKIHADAVLRLVEESKLTLNDINIIGMHGQTIYHNPDKGVTWQIGNGPLLAEYCKTDIICDFRQADMAVGGCGAPLVPIFHKALIHRAKYPAAVINIGGVANLSYIDNNNLIGFDTGPGNAIINDLMQQYFDKQLDVDGNIAAKGAINKELIEKFIADSYFISLYPKSLDRNHFAKYFGEVKTASKPEDLVATATYLTAKTILKSFALLPNQPKHVYICGGGARNKVMMQHLRNLLPTDTKMANIDELGFNADFLEAQAFAFLAVRSAKALPMTFPATTGCMRPVSGGILCKYVY